MTLSPQDRMTLEHDSTALTAPETAVIRAVFTTLYQHGVAAATNDRAAALEAALVRFLIASRANTP